MARLNFHPAPGLGDLLPGYFVVPQNPIRDAGTPLVPSLQATMPNRSFRIARIGELMPGQFTVPQNPLMMALTGGMGGLGCGCSSGCSGGNSNYTLNGMGALDMSSMTSWLTDPSPISDSVPNWMLYGAVGAALWFITQPSGSAYRAKRKALRSEYAGYKQAARSTGSAISSIG